MSKQQIWKGAGYIYLQAITWIASGYIFWIIMSKITTTEVIGTYSAIVAFAEIFANIAILGLVEGVQRFLGKSLYEQKLGNARVFLKASFLILAIGIVLSTVTILFMTEWINGVFGFDFSIIIVLILLVGSSALYMLLDSIIISSLRTKVLPIVMAISSAAKLFLAIILGLLGAGIIALTLGYTLFGQLLSSLLFAIVVVKIFKRRKSSSSATEKTEISLRYAFKNILIASLVTWVPLLIPTLGSDLGTLIVFGTQGSSKTAVYFIAFTVVTGITGITYSFFAIALPALSGMKDGRKRFTWQTIRLSAFISLPFSSSLIFYSKEVMQLAGQDYIDGTLSLQILLLSILPTIVLTGIDTLVYSYGNYRQSLGLGLAMTIPRTILYFILVPTYGGAGAAISYTAGSIIGFGFAIILAKRIGMQLFWKDLILPFFIPLGISWVLYSFQVHFIIGITVTNAISYLVLLKLRVLTRPDIQESIGILPDKVSNQILNILDGIDKKLKLFQTDL